jgi:hypothetical protein
MISIALTKEVQTKGSISVKYEKWEAMAQTRAAVEAKNSNQYNPVFFFCCSMRRNLCEVKQTRPLNQSQKNQYLRTTRAMIF